MTEKFAMEVVLDAKTANAELDKLAARAMAAGGGAAGLATSLDKTTAALEEMSEAQRANNATADLYFARMRDAGDAVEVAGEKTKSASKQLGEMKERLEKSAGAFAALSLAMGAQDTAAGKVLSSVGQLAAAYGAGGPLALGLAVGAAAVSALSDHWNDVIAKQDAYLAKQYAGIEGEIARTKSLDAELVAAQGQLNLLRTGVEAGDTISGVRASSAGRRAELESRRAALSAQRSFVGIDASDEEIKAAADRAEMRAQEIASIDQQMRKLDELEHLEIDIVKARRDRRIEEEAERKAAEAKRKAEEAKREEEKESQRRGGELAEEFRWLDEDRREAAKLAEDARKEEENQAKKHAAELLKIEKQLAADKKKIREDTTQQISSEVSAIAAAVGELAGTAIAGQEDVFAKFLEVASRAAGGAVMLSGGKVLAEGVGLLVASSGTSPQGWAMASVGAGLVGVGSAIQTAGPSAVGGLLPLAGRASAGGASASSGASEVGTGSTGSGGRRGSTIINITYGGASGPTADDGARAVYAAIVRADRQGIRPPRGIR